MRYRLFRHIVFLFSRLNLSIVKFSGHCHIGDVGPGSQHHAQSLFVPALPLHEARGPLSERRISRLFRLCTHSTTTVRMANGILLGKCCAVFTLSLLHGFGHFSFSLEVPSKTYPAQYAVLRLRLLLPYRIAWLSCSKKMFLFSLKNGHFAPVSLTVMLQIRLRSQMTGGPVSDQGFPSFSLFTRTRKLKASL